MPLHKSIESNPNGDKGELRYIKQGLPYNLL